MHIKEDSPDSPLKSNGPLPPPLPKSQNVSQWRIVIAFLIFGLYPLWMAVLNEFAATNLEEGQEMAPALGGNSQELLNSVLFGLIVFIILLAICWVCSRFTMRGVGLNWLESRTLNASFKKFFMSIFKGMGWSIVLRFLPLVVLLPGFFIFSLFTDVEQEQLSELVPKVETLISRDALSNDPFYLFLNLSLVSFVVAGLREELWRGVSFFLLQKLFPESLSGKWGKAIMILSVALIFGVGHLPQGIMGVLLTTVLGIGLGFLQVWHKSIWEATMAHGFFNATSFLLMAYGVDEFLQKLSEQAPALFSLGINN